MAMLFSYGCQRNLYLILDPDFIGRDAFESYSLHMGKMCKSKGHLDHKFIQCCTL